MTLLGVDPKAKTAVRASQAKLVEDRCRQVMDATDANGDGKLDFLEFWCVCHTHTHNSGSTAAIAIAHLLVHYCGCSQAVGHLQYADKIAATRAKPIANSSLVMK